jgi:hypothetical protein
VRRVVKIRGAAYVTKQFKGEEIMGDNYIGAPSTEYALKAQQGATCGQYIPPTQRQQLNERKALLTRELANVEAALAALDAHPDLEEFTKVLQAALR